jgi:hypothetical protein
MRLDLPCWIIRFHSHLESSELDHYDRATYAITRILCEFLTMFRAAVRQTYSEFFTCRDRLLAMSFRIDHPFVTTLRCLIHWPKPRRALEAECLHGSGQCMIGIDIRLVREFSPVFFCMASEVSVRKTSRSNRRLNIAAIKKIQRSNKTDFLTST